MLLFQASFSKELNREAFVVTKAIGLVVALNNSAESSLVMSV